MYAYPSESQDKLRRAREEGRRIVDLGPSCFNAMIRLDFEGAGLEDGFHFQTTPPQHDKQGGVRSVAFVPDGVTAVPVFFVDGRWTLHQNPRAETVFYHPTPEVPTEVRWEWSSQVNLARAREVDWIPYAPEASDELEAAWLRVRRGETSAETVSLCTGQSTKAVHVVPASTFFEQRDARTGNRRWVRRSFRTKRECDDKRDAMEQRAASYAEDSCAICTEAFSDTPHWPLVTTACGHPFHACCLQECKTRTGPTCPLCRASV